ncbi:sulfite exporter TauE/SafE family protein [Spirulina major CS-329]|uniref:sulfite exporter TauE/SafE family protein n=1 Tax=Spirulina TaxID=1154 RepID=UPI0023302FA3|nr:MULTISPECIES: sulfite exporter TauE/SafE family protein [Spirulina]MDB9496091.1 sulfite exporter TauE/SafE family protein [Spirulina subsalsa CS-330]MDB9503600.1 sulfite exporter TauE/SafE family protein [Spirulina major CS-329]
MEHLGFLVAGGLLSGLLAGLLGIGGGTVLVPILVALGYGYDPSVATSSLAIVMTSLSGTLQNYRMGFLDWRRVIVLAIPAIATAQIGPLLVGQIPNFVKEAAFGVLLIATIFLVMLRKRLIAQQNSDRPTPAPNLLIPRLSTGAAAGLLAGLFGVGGGVIMVPLQMLLLNEPIKTAIQTSLGVIVVTAISACAGHAIQGNVLGIPGLILGLGGLVGAQISTRYLPKLPDRIVSISFRSLLALLSLYFFWRAIGSYPT